MEMTDKELDGRFINLQNGIDQLEKLLKTIVENQGKEIARNERRIDGMDERMNNNDSKTLTVETKLDSHIESHTEKTGSKRFSTEMVILVAIFALDKIGSWIRYIVP